MLNLQVKKTFLHLLSVFLAAMGSETSGSFNLLSDCNNEFSSSLYKTLMSGNKGENMFFSPISITTALSMTYAGARGHTAKQMKDVLRYNNIEDAKIHQSFKELNQILYESKDSYILKSANRLFTHQGFDILDEFQRQTKAHYDSEVRSHDFVENGQKAVQDINSWVESQTNGKIKDLLQQINPLTRLILVNAIYFKGNWLQQFDIKRTRRDIFHVSSNEKLECDMMFQKRKSNITYDSSNKCLVLEMPYKGNDLSMVVVLPDEVDGLAGLESKLSASLLQSWTGQFSSDTVEIWLPRFSLTQKFRLNDALIQMGMNTLFSAESSDLSGISLAESLYVSEVLHKAFIDVNEEGSEAAAATSVTMMKRSISRDTQFRADHPFLFFIRDQRTGAVLFMGRLVKPQNSSSHDEL